MNHVINCEVEVDKAKFVGSWEIVGGLGIYVVERRAMPLDEMPTALHEQIRSHGELTCKKSAFQIRGQFQVPATFETVQHSWMFWRFSAFFLFNRLFLDRTGNKLVTSPLQSVPLCLVYVPITVCCSCAISWERERPAVATLCLHVTCWRRLSWCSDGPQSKRA